MADQPVVHIGENSPEQVALKLLETIASVEQKNLFYNRDSPKEIASRDWILDTYAECLQAVKGFRDFRHID